VVHAAPEYGFLEAEREAGASAVPVTSIANAHVATTANRFIIFIILCHNRMRRRAPCFFFYTAEDDDRITRPRL
jgi:hypothetical protein